MLLTSKAHTNCSEEKIPVYCHHLSRTLTVAHKRANYIYNSKLLSIIYIWLKQLHYYLGVLRYLRLLTLWLAPLASMTLPLVYSGCLGVVKSLLSLSISRTDAMLGRFALSNWVHSSPISKHLFISVSWSDSSNKDGSNNSPILWYPRTFQAWKGKHINDLKSALKKETIQSFLLYYCELMMKTFWSFTNLE